MCCTRLAENTGRKSRHLDTIAQLCAAIYSQLYGMYRQSEKNSLSTIFLPHVGLLTIWWTSAHWRLRSVGEFGAPQQISTGFASWLLYCSDVAHRRPTKLRTMFSRLLGWYYVYIFGDSCPLMEICQLLIYCVQVLRSPILAVWLHGTRAAAVSQTLWRGTRNGITKFRRGRHLYSAGRPSRWASAHILEFVLSFTAKVCHPNVLMNISSVPVCNHSLWCYVRRHTWQSASNRYW